LAYKTWAKETEQADLPALAGGRPVREVYLPLNEPYLTREEISEATAVIESGRFSAGARVQEFEERFAERVGARYAVAVSTCTAALHAACYAAGISRGEEVIMSPLAPPAAGSAVIYIGAKPVFADVNEASLNLDPAEIERNITHNTRAIVVTHFAGHPCDIAGVLEVARRHQLVLVEDATEALGAAYRGQPVGSFGLTAAFSLNPEAIITAGSGGLVATSDEDTCRWLRLFTDRGIVRDFRQHVRREGPWHYEVQELGYDYRPTEIQGALGLAQFKRLDRLLERRREIAARYNEAFGCLPHVETPHSLPDTEPSWNLYVLRLKLELLRADRREIFLALMAEKINAGVHHLPVYLHPLYGWLGDPTVCTLHQGPPCPKAQAAYKRLITLPLYPKMSDADVDDVIAAVQRVLTHFAR